MHVFPKSSSCVHCDYRLKHTWVYKKPDISGEKKKNDIKIFFLFAISVDTVG